MGPKYWRPNSSNRTEGQSRLLAASSARRATVRAVLPPKTLEDAMGLVVQILVMLVGDDLVEVAGMAPTLRSMDHSLSLRTTIRRLVWSAILLSASKEMPLVKAASPATATTCSLPPERSRRRPCQGRGEGSAGVTGAVTIVLAFGAQHEAVEAAGLTQGFKAVEPSVRILWI